MAATCRGMQGFLRERRLCHMGQHSDRVRVIGRGDDEEHADHNCTESVNLVVFRHVVVAEIVPDIHRGLLVEVQFDQMARQRKVNDRKQFWTKCGDSLVCLAMNVHPDFWKGGRTNNPDDPADPASSDAADRLLFMKVAARDEDELGRSPDVPTFRMSMIGPENSIIMTEWIRKQHQVLRGGGESVFIQVQGVISARARARCKCTTSVQCSCG